MGLLGLVVSGGDLLDKIDVVIVHHGPFSSGDFNLFRYLHFSAIKDVMMGCDGKEMRKEETKIAFYDHYFYATVVLCCKEPGCTVRRAGLPLIAERCACRVRTVCAVRTYRQ